MFSEKMIERCEIFMLDYLKEFERRSPGDFDEDIIGGLDVQGMFMGSLKWNKTPFCKALGNLVAKGKVLAIQDTDGCWVYTLIRKK